ncbi:phenylacetate--CoA ligase family protein [Caldinitratiruptor microaerophilus]|uniref:Coenzyme F390 synthetase n=1 Tax=Caldinitratiruptor microaerophilus TaxID=671077 RepID=A0AA35CN34_9FIRM|nr:AMP-binding protein [Caldinitratiruptor microaerophilus]BDG61433.1 coenzyme F390 synthetase [Caldinitratiruptor microaerophilus]
MTGGSVWLAAGAGEALRRVVRHAWDHSPAWRARLEAAGIRPEDVRGPEDLLPLPVLRKEALGRHQAASLPFGGLLGVPVSDLARIFVSPGPVYDPQGAREDFWRFSRALRAAGFAPGDVVLNCFSYHLSPAGFMLDTGLRAAGCVVIPGGVGQQDLQVRVLSDTGATGYVGLPSYLLSLLERAEALGLRTALRKAYVTAEPLPPSLRARLQGYGVEVFQGFGTADLGSVAYECEVREGQHLDPGVMVEVCDPEGRPVPAGEVGELVVTLLDETYPLLRFGTGDLTALVPEPCPCGRPEPRIRGWLGRAGEAVKVRGMFVYPDQIQEAVSRIPGAGRWHAVVDRDGGHRDRLTVRVEAAGVVDPAALSQAIKATTRVTAEVELVEPGTLPDKTPRIEDRRRWE